MASGYRGGGPNRFKVRVLFGLIEADATGTIAIGATVLVVFLVAAGRYHSLW